MKCIYYWISVFELTLMFLTYSSTFLTLTILYAVCAGYYIAKWWKCQ